MGELQIVTDGELTELEKLDYFLDILRETIVQHVTTGRDNVLGGSEHPSYALRVAIDAYGGYVVETRMAVYRKGAKTYDTENEQLLDELTKEAQANGEYE
jgi:hypothetical protein